MTRKTTIRVPKTDNGKRYLENESNTYDAGDYDTFPLDEGDVEALTPVFLEWNRRFGILIDDCEEEVLPAASIEMALSILARFASDKPDGPSSDPFKRAETALRAALARGVPAEIAL